MARVEIHKFQLTMDGMGWVKMALPAGSKVIHFDEQNSRLYVWAEVESEALMEERVFRVVMTGQDFNPTHMTHRGTKLAGNGLVVHLYEANGDSHGN